MTTRLLQRSDILNACLHAALLGTIFIALGCVTARGPEGDERTGPENEDVERDLIRTIHKSEFDSTFFITHGTPDHSHVEWADEPYTKWYIAYREAGHSENVYYDRKQIDLSGINNTADFLTLNTENGGEHVRNRFFYDEEYDDPSFDGGDTELCLQASLDKLNWFRSNNESGKHEWFIKHWAFIAARGAGNAGEVFDLEENPSEDDTFHTPHGGGTNENQTLDLGYDYHTRTPSGLCILSGQRTGVIAQVIENDNGGLNDDTEKLERLIAAFAEGSDNAETDVGGAVFFFAEFASYVNLLVTNARKDDRLYPISLSFTWGALKRMHEKSVQVQPDASWYIRPQGVPESPDRIRVSDMWPSGSSYCNHGDFHPPGSSERIDYRQYCLDYRPANERSYPKYDDGGGDEYDFEEYQDFYLPSNVEARSVNMYFTLGVAPPTMNNRVHGL